MCSLVTAQAREMVITESALYGFPIGNVWGIISVMIP